jgi:hypothetical protein
MPWSSAISERRSRPGEAAVAAVADVLRVLKKNRWAIPVGIEFEYPVPAGSTWDAEIAKCVKYGKDALS